MAIIRDAGEVIDALGGNNNVRQIFRFVPSAVANWRALGAFPPDTFVIFNQELKKLGAHAHPGLWRMRGHLLDELELRLKRKKAKAKARLADNRNRNRRHNGKAKAR